MKPSLKLEDALKRLMQKTELPEAERKHELEKKHHATIKANRHLSWPEIEKLIEEGEKKE